MLNWLLSLFSNSYRPVQARVITNQRGDTVQWEPVLEHKAPFPINIIRGGNWKRTANLWDYVEHTKRDLARAEKIVKRLKDKVKEDEKVVKDYIHQNSIRIANEVVIIGGKPTAVNDLSMLGKKVTGGGDVTVTSTSKLTAPSIVERPRGNNNQNKKQNNNQSH